MKHKILPYNPKLKSLAKDLRKRMTVAEVILWGYLKQKQIMNFDFDRQRPIDEYIVDFYCKELRLAVEVDGITHDPPDAYVADITRQQRLESLGVRFLRFRDEEIKENIQNVIITIQEWIRMNQDLSEEPTPSPPKRE